MPKIDDDSLADAATESEDVPDLTPEDFDFEAWLNGVRPIRAQYTLFGQRFIIYSRSSDWRKEFEKKSKKWPSARQDAAFVVAHLEEPVLSIEQVEKLQKKCVEEAREGDINGLVQLMIQIDTRPEDQINERFLLPASD